MDWSKTHMTEPEERAKSIYNSLGPIEGHIHILQLQWCSDEIKNKLLINYWMEVMGLFKEIKSKDDKSIRDWLA
jgi:hypothetical protein